MFKNADGVLSKSNTLKDLLLAKDELTKKNRLLCCWHHPKLAKLRCSANQFQFSKRR